MICETCTRTVHKARGLKAQLQSTQSKSECPLIPTRSRYTDSKSVQVNNPKRAKQKVESKGHEQRPKNQERYPGKEGWKGLHTGDEDKLALRTGSRQTEHTRKAGMMRHR